MSSRIKSSLGWLLFAAIVGISFVALVCAGEVCGS